MFAQVYQCMEDTPKLKMTYHRRMVEGSSQMDFANRLLALEENKLLKESVLSLTHKYTILEL